MSRPASAAGTPTAPPSIAHKRTKSTPKSSPSTALQNLYITNLRLLNLDLLPDWPGITTTTFSNADGRARIKAVEWSLYQLFRLFDPALTADKLQPFFPPLEPLQSVNLRAALWRCLEGLKKSGVLGREAVVRKTMLDDCSGDKLWEVCLGFSAVVLRKIVLEKKGVRPVAQRLGTAQGLGRREREMLEPLLVAHRVSLGKALEEKRRAGEGLDRLERVLEEKEGQLEVRRAELKERGGREKCQKQLNGLKTIEKGVRKHWVGDDSLKEALISGEHASSGDRVLLDATDAFLNRADKPNAKGAIRGEVGLIEDVEAKARSQNLRIRRWQAMYDKLQGSRSQQSAAEQSDLANGGSAMHFNKHQDLSLQDIRLQSQSRPAPSPMKSSYPTRYDSILTSMRDDLRRTHKTAHSTSQAEHLPHKRSMTTDAVVGAEASAQHSRSSSTAQSPSKQNAPFRPGLGRRVSSQSRSYHQPKVISQREPIPLKSELFSPLKSARPGGGDSPGSAASSRPGSMLATPREDVEMGGFEQAFSRPLISGTQKEGLDGAADEEAKIDSAVGLGLNTRSSSLVENEPAKPPGESTTPEFRKPTLPPPTQSTQPTPRLSLAERARMSMARPSTSSSQGSNTSHDPSPPTTSRLSTATADTPPTLLETPTLSLADRTRQSIANFPPPSVQPSLSRKPTKSGTSSPRKPPHTRTQSSITPSSHSYETPRKSRRSSFGASLEIPPEIEDGEEGREGSRERDLTPREKLFDQGVDYDSVFKSRPRVAVSPSPSPSPFAGKGGVVEGEVGSPLR